MFVPQLTLNSFGGGQDSTAITYKLILDPAFREKYAPKDLITLMSATGNEHPQTDAHVVSFGQFVREAGLEFVHLTPEMGFHSQNWLTLQHHFTKYDVVMSVAFPKSCTDQLKIQPIYKFMEAEVLGKRYGCQVGRKKGFYEFKERYGPIRVLIGISAEEDRVGDRSKEPKWSRDCLEKVYPLKDLGMTRQDCQDYIRSVRKPVPPPSNCIFCPFMSEIELLWLYYNLPEKYYEFVEYERRKFEANKHMGDRNLGVFGKKPIPEVLQIALKKFGHMTREQIQEYKMSHGHNVCSKY